MKVYVVCGYCEFEDGTEIVKAFFNKEKAEKFEKELYTKRSDFSSIRYDIKEVEVEE